MTEGVASTGATSLAASKPRKLNNLQILRAVAALLVVAAHAVHEVSEGFARYGLAFAPPVVPGPFGVEIFFVISGFIILFISYDRFSERSYIPTFVKHRLLRIVPLYWLFTLIFVASALVVPGALTHPKIEIQKLVTSLLFIVLPGQGGMPVYQLGWSLNFEMFFYALFTIALIVRRPLGMAFLTITLVSIFLYRTFVGGAVTEFYGRHFILEFLAGAWMAYFARSRGESPSFGVLPAVALLIVVLVCLVYGASRGIVEDPSFIVFRMAAAIAIVAAFVFGRGVQGKALISRALIKIGDGSYSLYLSHPFVLGAVVLLARRSGALTMLSPWVTVAVCILLSVAAGWACHILIEKPLLRIGQKRSSALPAPQQAACS